jgi:hypothetical protein
MAKVALALSMFSSKLMNVFFMSMTLHGLNISLGVSCLGKLDMLSVYDMFQMLRLNTSRTNTQSC